MSSLKIKFLSLFLVMTLIVTMMPINVFATSTTDETVISLTEDVTVVESGACGKSGNNVLWQLDSEGTLTIFGKGEMADYTWINFVPNTPWYKYCNSIQKIVVNDGVTSIGSSAFFELNYVKSVEITNDILAFKSYAFAFCYKIQTINLPDNLQYIGDYCFKNCNVLLSIIIPESVIKFGDCVFEGCSKLKEVQLPSNMEILPRGFFYDCKSLENVSLPNSITELVSYCFADCTGLKSITFPANLTTIGHRVFSGCTSLEELTLPNTITTLGLECFYNCSNLVSLNLPCNIETIPKSLCYGCTKLESIEIPESTTSIGDDAFYNCSNLSSIFVPKSVTSIGTYAYGFYKDIYDEISVMPNAKMYCYEDSVGKTYALNSGVSYSIIDIDISTSQCQYTGNSVTPDVVIMIDGQMLEEGSDYTVEYENNVDIGTAIAKIKFINDYDSIKSVIKKNYRIGKLLNECEIIFDREKYQYHTSIPNVTIKSSDYTLVYGVDYEVYYTLAGETWKKTEASNSRYLWGLGECLVRIVGLNQYIGEEVIVVTVNKFDISNAELMTPWISQGDGTYSSSSFDMKNYEYDGAAKTQSGYRVCDDNDTISEDYYEVSYRDNIEVGTATMVITGKGDYYTGTLEKQFEIYPRVISSIKVTKKPNKIVYNNSESTVSVVGGQIKIFYQDGGQEIINMKTSMLHGDYNLSSLGIHNIWLTYKDYSCYYKVTVIEDLSAPKTVTANLYGYNDIKVTWSKVSGSDAYNVYYKKSTADSYTYLGRTSNTYYNKANLSDGVKYYFKVVPCTKVNEKYYSDSSYKTTNIYTLKKVEGIKVTKSEIKVKVSWKNISGETGYQISKYTNKSGTNIVATYKTTSGKSKIVSAIKGKTYYYKVRAYKVVDGKKIYGPWSTAVKYVRK